MAKANIGYVWDEETQQMIPIGTKSSSGGGVDQAYVDQQDQKTLQDAKDYTDSKLVTIEIEDRGGNNFWTRPVTTANQIIDMVNAGKEVRLSFYDTITNTGDQLYPYENTRQSVCYFRRNIITEDKISRVSWGVQFDGSIVAQEIVPTLATNATEKVNETLADITSLDSFYTHFYGLRKSPVRRYQFEYTQNGIHQNIADAIGLPAEYPAADKGFIYVDLPYSEAGGFMIVVTLEGRTNGQLWKQSHWATLNSTWHKSEWVDQTKQPSGGGIDLGMTGATVGQIAEIEAVDENGMPTKWKPIDKPSGGGRKALELIVDTTVDRDTSLFKVDVDRNGKPFDLIEMHLVVMFKPLSDPSKNPPQCPIIHDKSIPEYLYWNGGDLSMAGKLPKHGETAMVYRVSWVKNADGTVTPILGRSSWNTTSIWETTCIKHGLDDLGAKTNKAALNDTSQPLNIKGNLDCIGLGSQSLTMGPGTRVVVYGVRA